MVLLCTQLGFMSNLHIAENEQNEIKVVPKILSVVHTYIVSSTAGEM